MAEQRVQRRLAAILVADVVGYSRMIREDETGTLAQLKTLRRETLSWMAMAYFYNEEPDLAVELARRGMRNRQAPQTWSVTTLMTILGHLGLRDEARETCSELLRTQPDINCSFVRANIPISDANNMDRYIDGLRKAGLPE